MGSKSDDDKCYNKYGRFSVGRILAILNEVIEESFA